MSLIDRIDPNRLPGHVAIIMDGNGRWAKSRGLERGEGHKEGIASVRKVVEAARKLNIPYLTLYAFSTENWDRPAEEVSGLMDLMVHAIAKETEELKRNDVKVHCIGDVERLPNYARTALIECIRETEGGTALNVVFALSYSSKWEITQATRQIVREVMNGRLRESDIDEETLASRLTTSGMPNPDLLIRTGESYESVTSCCGSAPTRSSTSPTLIYSISGRRTLQGHPGVPGRERRYGKTSEQLTPFTPSKDTVTNNDESTTLN